MDSAGSEDDPLASCLNTVMNLWTLLKAWHFLSRFSSLTWASCFLKNRQKEFSFEMLVPSYGIIGLNEKEVLNTNGHQSENFKFWPPIFFHLLLFMHTSIQVSSHKNA
jgi:hypothetical protein